MDQDVIEELSMRPGVDKEIIEFLYDDAVQDMCEFCNLKESDISYIHKSTIKDLIMYRYNTLGTEGIRSENYPSVSYAYERDIPSRIKTKLRSFRRLSYGSNDEIKKSDAFRI